MEQSCEGTFRAHLYTCFLSSQSPRYNVTLGWFRFLEGLDKHLKKSASLGKGLRSCAQFSAAYDGPDSASALYLLQRVVPVGLVACRPRLLYIALFRWHGLLENRF